MLHNATYLGAEKSQKEPEAYHCEKCDFFTSKLGNWKRHLKTKKHDANQMLTDANHLGPKGPKGPKESNGTRWQCGCGKAFGHKSSLSRHKRSCKPDDNVCADEGLIVAKCADKDEMIVHLLKKMDEQHKIITDLVQRVGNNNNNTISNNSHNNINIYLNEQCKDAMSIQTFAKQLAIDIGNEPGLLYNQRDHKPLCDLISKRLTILDQTMRPLHSHKKTMYMKDEQEGWNKDENGKAATTIIAAAKKAELNKVGALYPEWGNSDKEGDKYLEAVSHLTCEVTKKERDELEKMECLEIKIDE